tara:strand:+ start:125952 stop:126185 length:234 start_codon:yes stop_codon:yes gene_type:complete
VQADIRQAIALPALKQTQVAGLDGSAALQQSFTFNLQGIHHRHQQWRTPQGAHGLVDKAHVQLSVVEHQNAVGQCIQ